MEREIYLVLTQTGSVLSAMIKLFTRAKYNHISLSLFSDLDPMWSFGRRRPYNPFWGGFVKEYIYQGTFHRFPRTECLVLSLPVTEEQYTKIQNILEEMYAVKDRYGYDLKGLIFASMKIYVSRKYKYYCSDFVRSVLKSSGVEGAENLPQIVQPENFLHLNGVRTLYQGLLSEYPTAALLTKTKSLPK